RPVRGYPSRRGFSMGKILDGIRKFFVDDQWPFTEMEGKTILRTGFSGKNGKWTCFAQARENQQQFIFYSVCPNAAPDDKRPAAMEFITRANYGLVIGNFEMDVSDGEIRYKTSIDVEGGELNHVLIRQVVYSNVMTMNKYLPGLMSVLYANVSPEQAIHTIEGKGG
ncbi:MAG TPA: YbjN domain-containing protein, partial [Anaerolineales bacterium]